MRTANFVPCTWIEDLKFDWSPYAPFGSRIYLPKDRVLFHYRQTRDTVYAVVQGRIRLSLTSEGGEEKTFVIIGKNGLLGEAGLYDGEEHVTNAIANVDSTLYAFRYPVFRNLLQSSTSLSEFCIANLGRKLQILTFQSMELTYTSAQHRVIRSLLELSGTYGTPDGATTRIAVRFTQQEMAGVVGVSRVTVAQVFRELTEQGLLERHEGHYVLPSPLHLTQLLVTDDKPKQLYF